MLVKTPEELRELYGFPSERASQKELQILEKHSINFIAHSPFLIVSTFDGKGKMDASPRGGKPGFVKVLNDRQIIIPDIKGNNRIDSLINIVETGRIATLFLIPGIDETLRLNGSAVISTNEQHLSLYNKEKNPPKSCVIINVEEFFLHCAKAFMRSELWRAENHIARPDFPTMGKMLKDQLGGNEKVEDHKDMVERYKNDL